MFICNLYINLAFILQFIRNMGGLLTSGYLWRHKANSFPFIFHFGCQNRDGQNPCRFIIYCKNNLPSKHLLFSVKRFLLIQYMKQNATEVVKLGRPFCGQPLNLKGSLKHVSLESHSISPFSAVISLLMPFYAIKCLSRRKSFIKYYIVLAHKHQESWVIRKDIFRLKSSKQLLL